MKQTILARRYSKALFAVSKEEGTFEKYSESLQGLRKLFAESPQVVDALTNPLYPLDAKEKVMVAIADSIGADKIMVKFLGLLVQKKRAEILPEIAEEFQAMVNEENNIVYGSVVTAIELSSELQSKVQATLEKLTGKKVKLISNIDPSILGGIVAKVGDLVLDGSIKAQLAGLNDSIKGRE